MMVVIILPHQTSVTCHDLAFRRVTFLTTFTTEAALGRKQLLPQAVSRLQKFALKNNQY